MSFVHLLALGKVSSAMAGTSRLNMTLASTLPTMETRGIPLYL